MKAFKNDSPGLRGFGVFFAIFFAFFFSPFFPSPARSFVEAARVRIAVLPFKVHSEKEAEYLKRAVMDMLASRLGSAGDVEILRKDVVAGAIKNYPDPEFSEEAAASIGRELDADFVLFGSLSVIGAQISLDAKLVNVKDGSVKSAYSTGRGMDSIVDVTGELASKVAVLAGGTPFAEKSPARSYMGRFTTAERAEKAPRLEEAPSEEEVVIKKKEDRGFIGKKGLSGTYEAVEFFDLDRDGKKELILMGEKELVISRFAGEGVNNVKVIIADDYIKNVSVSAFDANSENRPELYVSRLGKLGAEGCILEFRDNDFTYTSCGIPFLMRAIRVEAGKAILLGQSFSKEWGLGRKIKVLEKEGGGVAAGEDFPLPEGVGIYDFEVFDVTGEGEDDIVALDDKNNMRIYTKKGGRWEEEWRSQETYGGTLNIADTEKEDTRTGKKFTRINGSFLYSDLDGDGANDIIIKKNIPGGLFGERSDRVRSYKKGSVIGLGWDGATLFENWKTKELGGYIADFLIDDVNGDGAKEIVILVTEGGGLTSRKSETSLVIYKLTIQ